MGNDQKTDEPDRGLQEEEGDKREAGGRGLFNSEKDEADHTEELEYSDIAGRIGKECSEMDDEESR